MGLKGLFQALDHNHSFRRLCEGLEADTSVREIGLPEAAKPFLLAALWQRLAVPTLIICPKPEDARRLHAEMLTYLGQDEAAYLLPEPEVLPYERLVADGATNKLRMAALTAMGEPGRHPLVVTSVSGALRKTMAPSTLANNRQTLNVGQVLSVGQVLAGWVEMGYHREDGVEIPGSFSMRGGIIDVYPPSSGLPARIELVGDEIESIRLFNPTTQRSVESVDNIEVIPAREGLPSLADRDEVSRLIGVMNLSGCTASTRDQIEEELASIFSGQGVEELAFYNGLLNHNCLIDHMSPTSVVVLNGRDELETCGQELHDRAEQLRTSREQRGELPVGFPSPQLTWHELLPRIESLRRLVLLQRSAEDDDIRFHPAPLYNGKLEQFAQQAPVQIGRGERVVVASRHAPRLAEILEGAGVGASIQSDLLELPPQGSVALVPGSLRQGWSLSSDSGGVTLLTDFELLGVAKERPSRHRTPVKGSAPVSQLVPGEYVVHVDHGVGRFAGTIKMEAAGEDQEYLVLEYAERDKLYVPTDHLDRISPYLAPNDQAPALTRLGTQEWARAKERARASTREMAEELLKLYATRQVAQGHAFSADSAWQRDLEDSFPYEETEDQGRTVIEVKKDMEDPHPMDRLVCGDVGYGKTEIALRAAFKTIEDGMQVATLVPTTVLAQQHYATFSQRLAPFPIRVEVLSRFRSPKEQQDVVERLKLGTVDLVVGTHRLLQKDISFKNLGLVIVDEEQRFGVTHKERLKSLRSGVDFLTLSATPIPRTLYMALSGIRDMSTMETPPEERLPIKTYVSEYSDEVVKEAILREKERGGQVFFLHNRINTINRVADQLRKLVPQATFAVGHGRMREGELEETMARFADGEFDVLVCTTIIESGLDIPKANTLIVDRADRFGLSQLYQLRGRVGRSSNRAYAYMLTPPRRRTTETAGKRLAAILEASELGAGFRIAMRDLEIRGAGNVLGAEQSGHLHAVGFELYAQLLTDAVEEVREGGEASSPAAPLSEVQAKVSLPLAAHIPDSYISHLPARLEIYRRLAKARSRSEVEGLAEELQDRFGSLPEPVSDLLYATGIRILATEAGMESVSSNEDSIVMHLAYPIGGARVALEKTLGPLLRVGNQQVHMSHRRLGGRWQRELVRALERLGELKRDLEEQAAALEPGIPIK